MEERNVIDEAANPEHIRDAGVENKFVGNQGDKVRDQAQADFAKQEKQREAKEHLEQLRTDRFDRRNDEYYENATDRHGVGARDRMMGTCPRLARAPLGSRSDVEATGDRAPRPAREDDQERRGSNTPTALNSELKPFDEARRMNKMYETDMSSSRRGRRTYASPTITTGRTSARTHGKHLARARDDRPGRIATLPGPSPKRRISRSRRSTTRAPHKANAAGRGGHGTLEDIAGDARSVSSMISPRSFARPPDRRRCEPRRQHAVADHESRADARTSACSGADACADRAPTQAITPAPTQAPPAHEGGVSVQPGGEHKGGGVGTSMTLAAQVHEPAATAPAAGPAAQEEPDADGGGEALPYWPALLPEFDKAQHDFGWMTKVAVEFKKAQIEGKQKAVDTLAVYGRYKEYSALRSAAAKKNQEGAAATGQATAANVGHASQTEGQAGQGEAKQGEAKGAANDKAATDLPEPESRGFWGRILGAVKRWAKNKAAQVFGWIQERSHRSSCRACAACRWATCASTPARCAGSNRRRTALPTTRKTSGAAATTSIKLGADATKKRKARPTRSASATRNIIDADTFMADVASFEGQLAEEKANAQTHQPSPSGRARRAGARGSKPRKPHAPPRKRSRTNALPRSVAHPPPHRRLRRRRRPRSRMKNHIPRHRRRFTGDAAQITRSGGLRRDRSRELRESARSARG